MTISQSTTRFARPPYRSMWAQAALGLALLTSHSATAQPKSHPKDGARVEQQADDSAGVVNINSASAEELMRLPGVGPAKADAILALRERLKRFPKIATIMRVRGIGRKTYARLKPMLTLEGPTTLVEQGKRKAKSKANKTQVSGDSQVDEAAE